MLTVVLAASDNPARASYQAVQRLLRAGHAVVPVGIRRGEVAGLPIRLDRPAVPAVDTVTLYLGAKNQPGWYEYILGLKPRRIVFNPGAENPELETLARAAGIFTEEACTLVLLATGQY